MVNSVYLAGISTLFTSGANESGIKFEIIAETSAAKFVFTGIVVNNGNVYFLFASQIRE